jgi:type I restriction enzyme, R subunit
MADHVEQKWLTRKRRIDPKLTASGWKLAKFDRNRSLESYDRYAIEEYETNNGPADYALCVGGKILGIVEAKKVTLGPQNVLTQAERYSRGCESNPLNYNGFRVPFLYSTNGEIIWHHDIRYPLSRSRQMTGFHTPEALLEMLQRDFDTSCRTLQELPNFHERLRPYQIEANVAIERAIANRKREMLVAMATGTGKTFTMANEIYRLMKSGVAKRILFLVDRRALAAHAVRTFAIFEAEPNQKFDNIYEVYSQRFRKEDFDESEKYDPKVLPTSYLTNPKAKDAFAYVCTIQRMTINLFGRAGMFGTGDDEAEDDDVDQVNIPIHAFDLIVADECHRGYTAAEISTWRAALDHFDAVKIGLTATPASHTTSYFKEVVYRYDYERAVREGFLVDYDVVTIKSDVRMNGIFLNEGAQVGIVDPKTGLEQLDLLEDERQFEATEVEEKITAPESNKKILEEIQKYTVEHEREYGRFPKILIFAVNDLPHTSHADQLVGLARDIFGQGDAFMQKITGTVDRPLQRIREFRNRDLPGIVVTVDMLSTGVDIPDLEYKESC